MLKSFLIALAKQQSLRDKFPPVFRKIARKIFPLEDYNLQVWKNNNPYVGTSVEWEYKGETDFTLGIIYDPAHYHRYYQSACLDLKISYKVIDIISDNWLEKIQQSGCVGFLQWPHIFRTPIKSLFDERLQLMEEALNYQVYPHYHEIWALDNKRRVRDWFASYGFEIPETHVFFDKEEAYAFVEKAKYPMVYKTVNGSVSRGVIICRDKSDAQKLVKQCFGKGVTAAKMDERDRQWGQIIFQEYLEDVHERRMAKIGNYYISIDKVRKGDFHSGSGTMKWGNDDRYFLDTMKDVAQKGNFSSMNVDFFVTKDGRRLINEMHSLFHGPVITDETNKGVYTYDASKDSWAFHPGNYYRNYACNMRVIDCLEQLNLLHKIDSTSWLKLPAFGYHELT